VLLQHALRSMELREADGVGEVPDAG
jgi:hypothetical protein